MRAQHCPSKTLSRTLTAHRAKSKLWTYRLVILQGRATPTLLISLISSPPRSLHCRLTSLLSLPPMHWALPTSKPLHSALLPECPSWGYLHTCSFSAFRFQDTLSLHLWSLHASYSNLWWPQCFLTSFSFSILFLPSTRVSSLLFAALPSAPRILSGPQYVLSK